jgi:IclR family transcriptional regulator, KDG regulon repressor
MVMASPAPPRKHPPGKKPYYLVGSLVKGLQVMELLARGKPLTITEVSRALDQDRSASNRFLLTLRDLDYVKDEGNGKYILTTKLYALAYGSSQRDVINTIARPHMEKLAQCHGQTVNLGRLEGIDIVTIEVVPGTDVIRFDGQIGDRDRAHTLAMGKAVLAFRSRREQKEYLRQTKLVANTPRTLTDPDQLLNHFSKVKQRGYAIDNEEWAAGVCCVAVPVFNASGTADHAISVSGPAQSMSRQLLNRIARDLRDCCRALSGELGCTVGI